MEFNTLDLKSLRRPRFKILRPAMRPVHCLAMLLFALSIVAAPLPPRPSGPVADFARVIDQSSAQQITLIAQALWEQASFGLVVATFDNLANEIPDEYAVRLYKEWGIGNKQTDEGVLVLLSTNPRRVRIEVGYGAEGYLNDAKAGRILDNYGVQSFRTGNYSQGLVGVCGALAAVVAQEKNITLKALIPTQRGVHAEPAKISPLQALLILAVLILLVSTPFGRSLLFWIMVSGLLSGGRRGGGGFGGGFGGGGFGGGFGGGRSGGGGAGRGF